MLILALVALFLALTATTTSLVLLARIRRMKRSTLRIRSDQIVSLAREIQRQRNSPYRDGA